MQLAIEKYIDNPQQSGRLPTRAAIFFDLTNQFNSVSHEEFKNVIAASFPELLPLVTLFYPTPSTTNGMADHGGFSSWKKVQVKDARSHLSLRHSLLHAYSNPLIAYSANAQPPALPLETLAMTAKEVFLNYSALLMTSHPAFTSPTSTFYVHKSAPAVPPLDASYTLTKPEY